MPFLAQISLRWGIVIDICSSYANLFYLNFLFRNCSLDFHHLKKKSVQYAHEPIGILELYKKLSFYDICI